MDSNQAMSRAEIDKIDRSSRAFAVYDSIFRAEKHNHAMSFRWHASDMDSTSVAIVDAVTSGFPLSRYFVGDLWTNYCLFGFNMPVVLIPYLKMLPDRLLDHIKHFHTYCGAHAAQL